MELTEIKIRDPFILPYNGCYYMYSSRRYGEKLGVGVYKSCDLQSWSEPVMVFEEYDESRVLQACWAPEVHLYDGKFYMLVTFKYDDSCRGTQILVSDTPDGKFEVWSDVITPQNWECLDGTLYVEDGTPYMVFCHEWLQVKDGEVCAVKMTKDLKHADGEPFLLWKASDANWAVTYDSSDSGDYITDGPFLFRDKSGRLCSLWSTFCKTGYAIGIAYSDSGTIHGSWICEDAPVYAQDGGHGMIFETFEGRKMLSFHINNCKCGEQRAYFLEFDI